ncbi:MULTISPECIES: radical SAM/SPASM domain-containing protein [unclassified Maridesulfovibrio]|uniref:radical SAM/SPASM domain-containing protein n=1 Tax=unclassified Maridesulfovibrio TaxID=2794999 RepID=UPI003B3D7F41
MSDNKTVYKDYSNGLDILASEVGPKFIEYRRHWDNAKNIESSGPLQIDFELLDNCNQRCIMCPRAYLSESKEYSLNTNVRLPMDKMKAAIDQAAEGNLYCVGFSIGEPLLTKKELYAGISHAAKAGVVDIILTTNGLLLDKECTERLLASELTRLHVSIDATTADTYSQIRGKGFDRVVSNLEYFLKRREEEKKKLPIVRVSFVEQEQNRHEKDDFVNHWMNKVESVSVQTMLLSPENKDIKSFDVASHEKKFDCDYPWKMVEIVANGDLYPCCTFCGLNHLKLGNIADTDIISAWKGKKMQAVKEGLADDSLRVCSVCQRF